jgi:hypothetical protein
MVACWRRVLGLIEVPSRGSMAEENAEDAFSTVPL